MGVTLAEVGVQGLPRDTHYLALHLSGKEKFSQEKFEVRYLCAQPIFSGFGPDWILSEMF